MNNDLVISKNEVMAMPFSMLGTEPHISLLDVLKLLNKAKPAEGYQITQSEADTIALKASKNVLDIFCNWSFVSNNKAQLQAKVQVAISEAMLSAAKKEGV